MWLVRDEARSSPEAEVEVTTSPDDICSACPHLTCDGCARNGQESETRTSKKDAAVLERLSLSSGDKLRSGELFALVAERFSDGLEDLCSSCRWFALGWCAEGIRSASMTPPASGRSLPT